MSISYRLLRFLLQSRLSFVRELCKFCLCASFLSALAFSIPVLSAFDCLLSPSFLSYLLPQLACLQPSASSPIQSAPCFSPFRLFPSRLSVNLRLDLFSSAYPHFLLASLYPRISSCHSTAAFAINGPPCLASSLHSVTSTFLTLSHCPPAHCGSNSAPSSLLLSFNLNLPYPTHVSPTFLRPAPHHIFAFLSSLSRSLCVPSAPTYLAPLPFLVSGIYSTSRLHPPSSFSPDLPYYPRDFNVLAQKTRGYYLSSHR